MLASFSMTVRDANARLKPGPRDCCVFCSYGDKKCPPKTNWQKDNDKLSIPIFKLGRKDRGSGSN
jgi:hypothetical protein